MKWMVTFYPADKGLESMIKSELHTVSNQGSPCVVVHHSGVVPNVPNPYRYKQTNWGQKLLPIPKFCYTDIT